MGVYNFILNNMGNPLKEEQIEKIVLQDGIIEYRLWRPCSICHNGIVNSYGRNCYAKYLATADDMDVIFNDKLFIKDDDAEFYTEDYEFYKKVTGVEPSEIDWDNMKPIPRDKPVPVKDGEEPE